MKKIKLAFLFLSIVLCITLNAQNKPKQKSKGKNYPESFSIQKSDFDKIMNEAGNSTLKFPSNIFIDQSFVQLNTKNGDMHFVKVKLSYFPKSYLLIQENGVYSTVVFIMSDDKSVFYKGKLNKEILNMKKCSEDDIVSE
ncbi:MAG: hypothetical protein WCR21_02995 [Bacteroidota bacterium]